MPPLLPRARLGGIGVTIPIRRQYAQRDLAGLAGPVIQGGAAAGTATGASAARGAKAPHDSTRRAQLEAALARALAVNAQLLEQQNRSAGGRGAGSSAGGGRGPMPHTGAPPQLPADAEELNKLIKEVALKVTPRPSEEHRNKVVALAPERGLINLPDEVYASLAEEERHLWRKLRDHLRNPEGQQANRRVSVGGSRDNAGSGEEPEGGQTPLRCPASPGDAKLAWADMEDGESVPDAQDPAWQDPPLSAAPPVTAAQVRNHLLTLISADAGVRYLLSGIAEKAATAVVRKEGDGERGRTRDSSRGRRRLSRSPSPHALERDNARLKNQVESLKAEMQRLREAVLYEQSLAKRFKGDAEAARGLQCVAEGRLSSVLGEFAACRLAAIEMLGVLRAYQARAQAAEEVLAGAGLSLPPCPPRRVPDLPPLPNVVKLFEYGPDGAAPAITPLIAKLEDTIRRAHAAGRNCHQALEAATRAA